MSYATIDNVKSMFRDFADNSDPAITDAEITLFLNNTTEIIDGKIGTLYSLPITVGANPKSFAMLTQLQMYMVAGIIDDILNSYSEADKKPQWDLKAEKLLNALIPDKKDKCKQCEPTIKLSDASYLGTSIQKGRVKVSATSGTIFKKGANNW